VAGVTLLLAIGTSIVFGCSDFVGGTASRRVSSVRVAALGQLVALGYAVPVAFLVHADRVTGADAGWALGSGVMAGCGLGLFYTAMARGMISLVVPLTAVLGATVPVAYGLVRGERPGPVVLSGIVLALVAICVVSMTPGDGRHPTSLAPIVFSLGAGVLFGLFIVFFSRISKHAGMWPIVLSRVTSSLVLGALAVALTARQVIQARPLVPAGLAVGTLEACGIVGLLLSLQRGPVAVASVLLSLYPVTTVLLATALLHERMTRVQLAGVLLALGAVLLIATR